jgi:tetratricopeptide (TPR) repeat protein
LEQISSLIRSRSLDKAADALARLVRKKGAAGVDWRQAASLATTIGDQDLALAAVKRWRDENPSDPHRKIAVINALGAVARHRDAARLAHKLQADSRAGGEGFFLEAYYQARFGRRKAALELYRRALDAAPHHTPAWEQIALLQGWDDFDADMQEMERLANTLANPAQLIPLHYALGRGHDFAGQFDKAFRYIDSGAALREQQSPFNPQPQIDYYTRLQGTFQPGLIERLQNDGGGEGAIFIVSAPRSGSTLVEQILAMSDEVTATGEHTLIRLASLALASMEPPDMVQAEKLDRRGWQQMAQTYLKGIRRRYAARNAFSDKSLLNHNFAGLIRILFPAAKLIWLRRDPRDVAWSCFRSRISANRWTQKMENCVGYLQSHERLCSHWLDVFGDDMLVVNYEDLVTTPDGTTARLFEHAGLKRPDNWDEFYRASNPVATASLAQVRQPLTTSAIGTWRRYEAQLAPVFRRLGVDPDTP